MSFPVFDRPVPDNGYAWWYIDALSDDRRFGLTVIAFIGSVFSPYYFHARQRRVGGVDPRDHCAINIALYGRGGRWAMTERGAGALAADRYKLEIGPSRLQWLGDRLRIEIDEWAAPLARRVRGHIEVDASTINATAFTLDQGGNHLWQPITPNTRVSAEFDVPHLRWEGHGYLDHNRGSEALEAAFADWQWSRLRCDDGTTAIHYDINRRDGTARHLALTFDQTAACREAVAPPLVTLAKSGWRIARAAHAYDGEARILSTLVDAPFYARSEIETRIAGHCARGVHESLSLTRFSAPWVRAMLPFRMPRRRGPRELSDRGQS